MTESVDYIIRNKIGAAILENVEGFMRTEQKHAKSPLLVLREKLESAGYSVKFTVIDHGYFVRFTRRRRLHFEAELGGSWRKECARKFASGNRG